MNTADEFDCLNDLRQQFLTAACDCGALRFGRFKLRSGRQSPCFFNMAEFKDGFGLKLLADCYAAVIEQAVNSRSLQFDVLFGPAYKGIPLAAAVAVALQQRGRNYHWAYNRKEVKDHGEGGRFCGAAVTGRRILLIDDVLSTGSAVREALSLLLTAGAKPVALVVGLNRQERGQGSRSAAEELKAEFSLQVLHIAGLQDLVEFAVKRGSIDEEQLQLLTDYRDHFGSGL